MGKKTDKSKTKSRVNIDEGDEKTPDNTDIELENAFKGRLYDSQTKAEPTTSEFPLPSPSFSRFKQSETLNRIRAEIRADRAERALECCCPSRCLSCSAACGSPCKPTCPSYCPPVKSPPLYRCRKCCPPVTTPPPCPSRTTLCCPTIRTPPPCPPPSTLCCSPVKPSPPCPSRTTLCCPPIRSPPPCPSRTTLCCSPVRTPPPCPSRTTLCCPPIRTPSPCPSRTTLCCPPIRTPSPCSPLPEPICSPPRSPLLFPLQCRATATKSLRDQLQEDREACSRCCQPQCQIQKSCGCVIPVQCNTLAMHTLADFEKTLTPQSPLKRFTNFIPDDISPIPSAKISREDLKRIFTNYDEFPSPVAYQPFRVDTRKATDRDSRGVTPSSSKVRINRNFGQNGQARGVTHGSTTKLPSRTGNKSKTSINLKKSSSKLKR